MGMCINYFGCLKDTREEDECQGRKKAGGKPERVRHLADPLAGLVREA